MFHSKFDIKKVIAIAIASLTLGVLVMLPVKAQDNLSTLLLKQIADNTNNIKNSSLSNAQFSFSILAMLNNIIWSDDSAATPILQGLFTNETNAALSNNAMQLSLLPSVTQRFINSATNSANAETPYSNDYTYTTMLNNPSQNPDPRIQEGQQIDLPLNYYLNVAGMNITHETPNGRWKGPIEDRNNYVHFYTTISAIQSFNAYILSEMYADAKSDNQLTRAQTALMQQASNSTWFTEISSEYIGIVLRQMLMYTSQIYVLLTQLIQTQKQLLETQAMTNTLLIIGNQFTETQLTGKAKGQIRTP